ncbi:MAG: carboxypeptidase regulatory-like domain-containing protein [Acidobacteriia bacterium]|nr:carboxypeptidase regulatory-like domain-containing protein [Terriglobia bacterium]
MKLLPLARVLFLMAVIFAAADSLWGQTTGTIRGTVKDPSGAVVPGARVTAVLAEAYASRSMATTTDGEYAFPALPVGRYAVVVQAEGFREFRQLDVEVRIGHVVVVNADLQLGTLAQVVTALASAPLIETTSTQLGAVVTDREVTQLPLNARDTYQLLQLQPGVQSQLGSDLFYGSDRTGVVSVNGGRGRSNNYTVNGGDANDQFANLPAIQPSPDSIEEFRVMTSTFDAEFGRNSGSVVNVVTKSGTNTLHGNLYEFVRNQRLNARNFFEATRPDFKQNQFGGTLGGPIQRDRSFFFLSYEGRRIHQGIPSATVTVPTAAEQQGDFSSGTAFAGTLTDPYLAAVLGARPGCAAAIQGNSGATIAPGVAYAAIFPGNIIPAECFDPTAADLIKQFVPLPNTGEHLYQASPLLRNRVDQGTLRIDQKLTDHQQFNGYYYFNDDYAEKPFARFQAGGAALPGFGDLTNERFQQINLTHTWASGATSVNELRFSFFREGQGRFLHPQRTNLVQNSCAGVPADQCFSDPDNPRAGITPNLGADHEGVPFIAISGGFSLGNNFEGELPQFGNTFQWTDNFTKVMGKHTLKFGADVHRQQFDQTLYFAVNGQYNYFGGGPNDVGSDDLIPNYLLGLPDIYLQGSAQHEYVRGTALYLYAEDSWKVQPNFSLNYGLRWELNTPIADIGGRTQTFRPGQDTHVFPCQLAADNPLVAIFGSTDCNPGSAGEAVSPRGLVMPGDPGIPLGLTQTYYRSFAPRLGLAWSPGWDSGGLNKLTGGPQKTSLRVGWGLFYNPVEQLVLEQFNGEPPFGGSTSLSNSLFNTPFVGQDGTINPNPFNGILNPQRGEPEDFSSFRPILLYGQFQPKLRSQYSVQYNFNIQRQVTPNLLLQIGYVGSQGHRLLATHDLNFADPQTCLDLHQIADVNGDSSVDCGPFAEDSSYFLAPGTIPPGVTLHLPYGSVPSITGPNPTAITLVGLRRYSSPFCQPTTGDGCPPDGVPVFSSIFAEDTIANSNYNSLQVLVEKRFSKGLEFRASYTWSKSFDQASSFENVLNPLDIRRSWALSLFDARHRLVYSYVWQLPIPERGGWAGKLLNDWAISGIATFQTGFPIRITSSDDLELMNSYDFELPGEPDVVKSFRTLNPRGPDNLFFDPSIFQPQTLGTIGNAPRSICCGPGLNNFDIAIHKNIKLTEQARLEFRGEFFNAVNHAQFLAPDGNISDGADFGRVMLARDPRLIQFALKLFF